MLTLSAYRYRNVLAAQGGPIQSLEVQEWPVPGERRFQANARLREELVPRRRSLTLYGNVDGTGTDSSPLVARFMAISEALERWAYHATVHAPQRAHYGFDLDVTSNGMAAFPGLTSGEARRRALYEAIERASLFDWWEGRCGGELVSTSWPGTQAVRIANPLGLGVTVIAFTECAPGCFAYGHAAGASFESACRRAAIEMQRCGMVLCHHRVAAAAGRSGVPGDRFERRCLFFSTEEGHAHFQERIHQRPTAAPSDWRVAFDGEVHGPWSEYATVWRVVIPAATSAFLDADERYFFW